MCNFCDGQCSCHLNPPCGFCETHEICEVCGQQVSTDTAAHTVDVVDGSERIFCPDCAPNLATGGIVPWHMIES